MWEKGLADTTMVGIFDADGLQDALDYLGCF